MSPSAFGASTAGKMTDHTRMTERPALRATKGLTAMWVTRHIAGLQHAKGKNRPVWPRGIRMGLAPIFHL
ncbi:hypothetical protein HRbin23_00703 [bacterium HR23]|nr:hypothetical protein HRbin23_00703 [bacterium HR23]